MVDNGPEFAHPSGDRVLSLLSSIDGLVGEFVANFSGKVASESSLSWLDEWFRNRAEAFYKGSASGDTLESEEVDDLLADLLQHKAPIVRQPARLLSLQPHYFRGFRDLTEPINFVGDLIVVDGRNSSGKTSLAEAIEWLLTGELLRRRMQQYGNARELENCISYQLKPEDEETWVEAELVSDTDEHFRLRRVLRKDYGVTQTSIPETMLFLNGEQLSPSEEAELLDSLFAGVPPLLMQHSLRLFVHSTPSERRNYFERLLQLDELTYLIEKAVVGNTRLADFASRSGSVAWKRWDNLKNSVRQPGSRTALRKTERGRPEDLHASIIDALMSVATTEFAGMVSPEATFDWTKQILLDEQRKTRQLRFPILEKLRPQRALDSQLVSLFSKKSLQEKIESIQQAYTALEAARKAASLVGETQIAVARAFEQLAESGAIVETAEPQVCPLCNYQDIPTLTADRVQEISSWQPIQQAAKEAEKRFTDSANALRNWQTSLSQSRRLLIPAPPSDEEWNVSLKGVTVPVSESAVVFRQAMTDIVADLKQFDQIEASLLKILGQPGISKATFEQAKEDLRKLETELGVVVAKGREYASSFDALEKAVGSLIREDLDYSLRESWLSIADDLDTTIADIRWERAKVTAQAELGRVRDILIRARQTFLEKRRVDFSDGMTSVWGKLRADRYSSFCNLFIPEPRGKGFPVEIEVKATLDDGEQKCEVDALRVFSESQVNVLGIAAFVTRSRLVGHRILILDDPVQSMDEEHFKTFAGDMVQHLLDEGFQVILLTHNDTFAREVSFACIDMDQYVTMHIRHSRRTGCQVDEGNRRVAERLKMAERKGENGELSEAWKWIRLSLERLYTVVYTKHGPDDFNPLSWLDQSAEYMWDSGVGQIIEKKAPGSGLRLKEILDMTVAGAHDKSPKGFTDLTNAIKDIRPLLERLRIGAG